MLPVAKKVSRSPQPQILLCDLKAVSRFCHYFQPLPGLLVAVVGNQDAVGFLLSPTYPAPELVELAEAETVRVLHHHYCGVGHVHTYLHHRGGHQDLYRPGSKGSHNSLLLLRLHPAVDIAHLQLREHLLLEHFRILRHRLALVGDSIIFFHHGADHIGLTA